MYLVVTRFGLGGVEIERGLTRDGTAEPVSRDQILRREWAQGKKRFPVQLTTSRILGIIPVEAESVIIIYDFPLVAQKV